MARLLGVDERKLLSAAPMEVLDPQDGTVLGRLFESLVALGLQTYAQANESRVSQFRSGNVDREVDFIVHRGDRANVAFGVKLARQVDDHDVRHLLRLKRHLGDDLVDMVVVDAGTTAYRRCDEVAVVPFALLGP